MSAPTPPVITIPFARDAGVYRDPIPPTTGAAGRASYEGGFPPITMTPVIAGGIPPFGQDFNGILYDLTAQAVAAWAGRPIPVWSATVVAAHTGYQLGAVLAMSTGMGYWINLNSNNPTDPDNGGAGWAPLFCYGAYGIAVTGGIRTLLAHEYCHPTIVLGGSLAGNQAIVMPTTEQTWLIVNRCTMNGFTLTVRTAAGTGVDVPAGDWASPTQVYGNTLDINRTFSPAALPIDVAATPDTIPLRSNLGYLLATYLNQDSSLESGLTPDSVFVQDGGDGFLRKMPVAELAAFLLPEFAPAQSLTANGYVTLPGGLILQWGSFNAASGVTPVAFPVPFPNAAFAGFATTRRTGNTGQGYDYVDNLTAAGMSVTNDAPGAYWFAIGY